MLPRTYPCEDPVADALSLIGDRWTLLILRDVLSGGARFEELRQRLGIARNILAARLQRLTADGIVVREPIPGDGRAHLYRLGMCANELAAILAALEDFHAVVAAEGAAGSAGRAPQGLLRDR